MRMPTDPFATVVYILLLFPGIVYTTRAERRKSTGTISVFRETASVVVASSVTLFITWVAVVLTTWIPGVANWFSVFIKDPELIRSEKPVIYSAVLFGILVVSSTLAFVASTPRVLEITSSMMRRDGNIRIGDSAWDVAFESPIGVTVIVSVQFKNGDWLQAPLSHYNPSPDENDYRSLVLAGPILFRGSQSEHAALFDQEQSIVISASEIRYLSAMQDPDNIWLSTYQE